MATRSYPENVSDMSLIPHGHYNSNLEPNNSSDLSDTSDHEDQPRYLSQLAKGRAANFFINGDAFFPARKVIYNPKHFRDLSHYLDYLTDKLEPRFGAVRKICTPHHGHRIRELRDLQENGVYVAAGKERFKPYQYEQIQTYDKKRIIQPINQNADPVYQNRQYVTSGRIRKCPTQSLLIKVWPNGADLTGPRRVLLTPRVRPFTLTNVIAHVNEILKEDCLGTVDRLYFLTGVQVSEVDQITHNGQYVACRRCEKFKRARYNEQGTKNLSTSPRRERKLLAPLFHGSSNSMTHSSPEQQSNPSTQSSTNSNLHRRRVPQSQEIGQPVRPLQPNRHSDRAHVYNLEKDQELSFKARQINNNTQRTEKLQHGPETQQNVPAHRWQTKSPNKVLEANNGYKTHKELRPAKKQEPHLSGQNRLYSSDDILQEKDRAATKIQAAYRGHQTRKEVRSPKPKEVPRQSMQFSLGDRLEETDSAATKIQAAYRGHKTRIKVGFMKRSEPVGSDTNKQFLSNIKSQDEDYAATKIQAAYRAHQTRKMLGSTQSLFLQSSNKSESNRAAAKIQAGYRGYQQRKSKGSTNSRQEALAATKIQAGYRGYQTRQQLGLQQKLKKEKAASKIQAGFRGYQARNHIDHKKTAATKIQSSYRGYLARKNITPLHKETSSSNVSKEDNAAAKIQAGYRGYISRKQATSRRQPQVREDSYEELSRENDAAVTIQSHYRGYRARQELSTHRTAVFSDRYWP